jgi:hypothetical protein
MILTSRGTSSAAATLEIRATSLQISQLAVGRLHQQVLVDQRHDASTST